MGKFVQDQNVATCEVLTETQEASALLFLLLFVLHLVSCGQCIMFTVPLVDTFSPTFSLSFSLPFFLPFFPSSSPSSSFSLLFSSLLFSSLLEEDDDDEESTKRWQRHSWSTPFYSECCIAFLSESCVCVCVGTKGLSACLFWIHARNEPSRSRFWRTWG